MTYCEALNFIKNKESLGIKPGLVRVKEALQKLGNPQNEYKIIHIAGTNGKGTVAATISNELIKAGYKVGLFTSPWVTDYREQIQLGGEMISKNDFATLIESIKDVTEECTEFELLTVVAYKYFSDINVDYAVIECGMGGLDDATNVEEKNISVITSISLDHTDYLGKTVEEIAIQKAGILRKDCTCVLYNSELADIFNDKCAKLITVKDKSNLSLVNAALSELGVPPAGQLFKLPARQEILGEVMLDGGHNVSAAKKLAPYLENEVAVIGMLKDKDVEGYIKIIAPKCKKIFAVTVDSPRALSAGMIADICEDYCDTVYIVDNPSDAVKCEDVTLVCGSFYLARQVRKYLIRNL